MNYKQLYEALIKCRGKTKNIISIISFTLVFCIVYSLIIPAITITSKEAKSNGVYLESTQTDKKANMLSKSSDNTTESNIDTRTNVTTNKNSDTPNETDKTLKETSFPIRLEKTDDDFKIEVLLDKNSGLPSNTELRVVRIKPEDSKKYIEKFKEKIQGEFKADVFDISLLVDGIETEPESGVSVKITYNHKIANEDVKIAHIKDNGEVETIDERNTSEKSIEFKADSFSIYAVIDKDGKVVPTHTYNFQDEFGNPYTFKDSAGNNRTSQIIKDGERLSEVGIPIVRDHETFKGWFIYNPDTNSYGVEVNIDTPIVVNETKSFILRPVYAVTAYVTFYDSDKADKVYSKETVAQIDGTGRIDLTKYEVPSPYNTIVFGGWAVKGTSNIIPQSQAQNYPVTADLELVPVFVGAHKINFYTGDPTLGAPSIPSVFVKNGDLASTKKPSNPTWKGYTFDKWVIKGTNTEFNFNQTLTQDINLEAKWISEPTNYTIIYWQQKPTDDKTKTNDLNKVYEFAEQKNFYAPVGSTVYLNEATDYADNRYGVGFTLSKTRFNNDGLSQGIVIQPNGKTVVNIYYNRKIITMKFRDVNIESSYNPYISGQVKFWDSTTYSNVLTYTGLYGTTLAQNGYKWPSTKVWKYYASNNAIRGMSYLGEFILPPDVRQNPYINPTTRYDSDTAIMFATAPGITSKYFFYLQNVDGTYSNTANDIGTGYQADYFTISNKYVGFTPDVARVVYEDNYYSTSYSKVSINTGLSIVVRYPDGNIYQYGDVHVRYKRQSYNFIYANPLNDIPLAELPTKKLLFEEPIINAKPPAGITLTPTRPGYKWDGKWYIDSSLTSEYKFDGTMPAHDVKIYPGYRRTNLTVTVNSNMGVLPKDYPTSYEVPYGDTAIPVTPVREYIIDPSGTFRHAKDPVSKREYYTDILTDPNIDSQDKYLYAPNEYTFAGWYKIEGGRNIPFSFTSPIIENTNLIAGWRRLGEYKIIYSDVPVSLTANPIPADVRVTNVPIDNQTYNEQSSAIFLGRPDIPDGYRFRGWRLNGKDYLPKDAFRVLGSLANANKEIVVHPIIKSVIEIELNPTKITFDGNGGQVVKTPENSTVANNSITFNNLEINERMNTYTDQEFKRRGYTLKGWNHVKSFADQGEVEFKTNQEIGIDNHPDTTNTLYAVWEINRYKVTISKEVIGNEEEQNRVFTFIPSSNLFNENISLKHGETKTYEINYGEVIFVDETKYPSFKVKKMVTHFNEDGDDDNVVVDDEKNITVDGDITISFTNTRIRQRLVFQKVDAENHNVGLTGAVFDIYEADENGNKLETPIFKDLLVDGNGYILTRNGYLSIPVGKYFITETKAADGHILASKDIILTVTASDIMASYDGREIDVTQTDSNGSQIFLLKFANLAGVELPSTGGHGEYIYYLSGLFLILLSSFKLIKNKKQILRGKK